MKFAQNLHSLKRTFSSPEKTVLGFDDPSTILPFWVQLTFQGILLLNFRGPMGFLSMKPFRFFFVAPRHRLYGVFVHLARLGTGGSPLAEIP